MSEDKRKALRTQGRFSSEIRKSNGKSKQRIDKDKISPQSQVLNPPECASKEGVKYEKDSTYSFKQYSPKKEAEEINIAGPYELSKSENGTSRIIYETDFLEDSLAKSLFELLRKDISWNEKNIIIHGTEHPQPRLVAWYGPYPYSYSGLVLQPAEMPKLVQDIKERIQKYLDQNEIKAEFNSVLLNFYRNHHDSVSWHSDDELSMGVHPTIASVSLGAVRRFEMRKKSHLCENIQTPSKADYVIHLENGSLLIMDGCMQKDWEHRVPKEYHDRPPRINLTFRTVYPLEEVPQTFLGSCDQFTANNVQTSLVEQEVVLENSNLKSLNNNSMENLYDAGMRKSFVSNSDKALRCEATEFDYTYPTSEPDAVENNSIDENATFCENVSTSSCDEAKSNLSNDWINNGESIQIKSNGHDEALGSKEGKPLNANARVFVPKVQPEMSLSVDIKATNTESSCCVNEKQSRNSQYSRQDKSVVPNDLLNLCESSKEHFLQNLPFFLGLIKKEMNSPTSVFSERDGKELELLCTISGADQQTAENQTLINSRIQEIVMAAFSNENVNPRAKHSSKYHHGSNYKKNFAPRHNPQRRNSNENKHKHCCNE